jgi:DNA-binding transcriptional ArsR family regulator
MVTSINTDGFAGSQTDVAMLEECRRLASTWAPVLRALGNDERLLIVLWLAGTTCTVRELQTVTGLGQSLVSYHLQALREAGLVTSTAQGRANQYRLSNPDLDQLSTLIGNVGTSTGPSQPGLNNPAPALS